MRAPKPIKKYVLENIKSWVDFADQFGLELREHDIYFVYGTTKTIAWAVSAFSGEYKDKTGVIRVKAALNGVEELSAVPNISDVSIPSTVGIGKFTGNSPVYHSLVENNIIVADPMRLHSR